MSKITDRYSHHLTRPSTTNIASVQAWPDEVQVIINAPDGNLSVEQANSLAALLIKAVNDAPHLSWEEGVTGGLADDRIPDPGH